MAVYRTKVCFSVAAFMTADFQRSLDQVKRNVFFKKGNQIDVLISDKVLAVYLICIAIAAKFIVRLSPHKTNTPIVPKHRWATHPLHSSHPFALRRRRVRERYQQNQRFSNVARCQIKIEVILVSRFLNFVTVNQLQITETVGKCLIPDFWGAVDATKLNLFQ